MAQDDYIRTALRVPPDLHRELHLAAERNGRSFNAEILGRLVESFGVPAEVAAQQLNLTEELVRMRLQQQKLAFQQELSEGLRRMDTLWLQRLLAQKEGAPQKQIHELALTTEAIQEMIKDRQSALDSIDRQLQEMAPLPLLRYPPK